MKKYYLFILFAILFLAFILIFSIFSKNKTYKTTASNSESALTSQEDWEVGTASLSLDLTTSPGSMQIAPEEGVDLTGLTTSASMDEGDKDNVIDGNTGTEWGVNTELEFWWKIDLGEEYSGITRARIFNYDADPSDQWRFEISTDDSEYTEVDTFAESYLYSELSFSPTLTARYIRIRKPLETCMPFSCGGTLHDLEIYYGGFSATHTSGATQIDGGETFWEWETFTPSQSVPANTTLTYRFRSSLDGSDWGSWSGYQTYSGEAIDISELVTSRDGEDKYKYLQVESKFTSSDGVSTPTLSDYTIGYHINRAPDTPTAATAVIAD